jgi:hypothetical protein
MLIAHVVCGALATMLVIPAAVLVPRYARGLSNSRWWFPVHGSAMGIVALALVVAAFIIAVTNSTGGFNSYHRVSNWERRLSSRSLMPLRCHRKSDWLCSCS